MSKDRKATTVFESGLPVDGCSMRWKIRHFSAYLSHNLACDTQNSSERMLQSPGFSNSGHKWELQIRKWQPTSLGYSYRIGFYIKLLSRHESVENITVASSLTINGRKHAIEKNHFYAITTNADYCIYSIRDDELVKLLATQSSDNCDVAVIEVNVEVWREETITASLATSSENFERIPNKMTELWIDQAYTDVTLKCQGKKLKAHKLVLAAASPVFKAMFKDGTKEHEDNFVIIEDIR
jgi:hypothetical protein